MLFLDVSNRLENLRDLFLARLRFAPYAPNASPDVFTPRTVIVPGEALADDLTRAAADALGVSAGMEFSFLALWMWRRIAAVVPQVGTDSPFAPERLQWRIARMLEDSAFAAAHPALSRYLENADARMRYELAAEAARLFAAYAAYRPDWLLRWQSASPPPGVHSAHEVWQADLWRRLSAELNLPDAHPAESLFAALARMSAAERRRAGCFGSAHLFALPSLPPMHIDFLTRLSEWMDIYIYALNPCREYWLDMLRPKQLTRLEAAGAPEGFPVPHPLLANWGRQTQTLFSLLLERADEKMESREHFQNVLPDQGALSESAPILLRVRQSLLDGAPPEARSWPCASADRSVEIHAAHSRLRQLEILRDQLQLAFLEDASLEPDDALVLLPDLRQTAPLIDAVFSRSPFPYAIAASGAERENPVARLLLLLMRIALPPARLAASDFSLLLNEPLIAAALGLTEETAEALMTALLQAGARRGLEGQGSAEERGASRAARHSFRDALSRLMLGYALPAFSRAPLIFAETLPAGTYGGARARALGAAWLLLQRLESLTETLVRPRGALAWRALWEEQLALWLDALPLAREEEASLARTRRCVFTLTEEMAEGGETLRIPADVALSALEAALTADSSAARHAGVLTFAPISAARQFPARILCILGLEEGVFPHRAAPAEFDLMAKSPRPGDRLVRDEERGFFLDALLLAQERLYLSYTGKSDRDDSVLPPSLLISELLEFILRATGLPEERFVIRHPLQAFARAYFDASDSRLVSFRGDYAAAREKAERKPLPPLPFMDCLAQKPSENSEDAAEECPQRIAFSRLADFFRHPARAFLREELGIRMDKAQEDFPDTEPQIVEQRARYALAERLLPLALSGETPESAETEAELREALYAAARAGAEYPDGRWGEMLLRQEIQQIMTYAARVRAGRGASAQTHAPLEFSLAVCRARVEGAFSQLARDAAGRPERLVAFRYARARGQDRFALWLEHLCANALYAPVKSQFFSRDLTFTLKPPENPSALLADWIAAWRAGQSAVLPFYPESAWVWMREGEGKGRQTWGIPGGVPAYRHTAAPESADTYWALALRGQSDPLGADFAFWRETLLTPLLRHYEETPA
jgi:exodeoxyribonuclease V gamma subunit